MFGVLCVVCCVVSVACGLFIVGGCCVSLCVWRVVCCVLCVIVVRSVSCVLYVGICYVF